MKTTRIGKSEICFDGIETRGVLAGAYRNGKEVFLTHLTFVLGYGDSASDVRTGCRQPVDNIADGYSNPDGHALRPTCPTCAKVWDRLQGSAA